jgi:hypothetical protein
VKKLVKIQTVDSMTRHVDCFRPKTIRSLVLIKHGSCGFNESPILPLHYPIFLWSVWDGEFMINAFFIKILFNFGVELGVIVTSHSIDLHIKLILGSCGKLLEYFMNLALVLCNILEIA